MWSQKEKLEQLEADVLIVAFEPVDFIRAVADDLGIGWPFLADVDRKMYRAYGLPRASARALLSSGTLRYYAKAALKLRFPRLPKGDAHQLGGDFVIDREGMVRFSHRGRQPADNPPLSRLLKVLAEIE